MDSLSQKQKEILLDYMEEHKEFARRDITVLGPNVFKVWRQMWTNLSYRLNEAGSSNSTDKWMQVKTDQPVFLIKTNSQTITTIIFLKLTSLV